MMCAASASIGGAAFGQVQIQPVYNAMGAYSSGMLNVLTLQQPLAFQARNARLRAEAQQGGRASRVAPQAERLTFAPGNGARTVADYVERVSRQNPVAGGQLRTALAGQDVPALFGQIVAPFGLNNHDVADAVAAHLIMRTMVVTGAQPPSAQGARNVRDSVAQALAHDPKMASETYRDQIGGEAQLDFVLVNTTWRAMSEGTLPADAAAQYRRGVAASLVQEGINLDTTRLSEDGFVPK
jgi:hypothetical protein